MSEKVTFMRGGEALHSMEFDVLPSQEWLEIAAETAAKFYEVPCKEIMIRIDKIGRAKRVFVGRDANASPMKSELRSDQIADE